MYIRVEWCMHMNLTVTILDVIISLCIIIVASDSQNPILHNYWSDSSWECLHQFRVRYILISIFHLMNITHSIPSNRLTIYLPSGWPFIVVCVTLRFIEGVGTALFLTAGYTLITQLYPQSTGFIVVRM